MLCSRGMCVVRKKMTCMWSPSIWCVDIHTTKMKMETEEKKTLIIKDQT